MDHPRPQQLTERDDTKIRMAPCSLEVRRLEAQGCEDCQVLRAQRLELGEEILQALASRRLEVRETIKRRELPRLAFLQDQPNARDPVRAAGVRSRTPMTDSTLS